MEMLQNSFLQHLLFVFNPNQITLRFTLYENTLYCCALPSTQLIDMCSSLKKSGLLVRKCPTFSQKCPLFFQVCLLFSQVCLLFSQDKRHCAQQTMTPMRLQSVANYKRVRKCKLHRSFPLSCARARAYRTRVLCFLLSHLSHTPLKH